MRPRGLRGNGDGRRAAITLANVTTALLRLTFSIGDEIEVTVLSFNGNHVRLGITAPMDVPVDSDEFYDRIHFEKAG